MARKKTSKTSAKRKGTSRKNNAVGQGAKARALKREIKNNRPERDPYELELENDPRLLDGFEEQTGNFWKPKSAGEQMIGSIVDISRDEKNDCNRYTIDIGKDETIVLPTHATLTGLLRKADKGDMVNIVCTHVGSGRGNVYRYRVGIK